MTFVPKQGTYPIGGHHFRAEVMVTLLKYDLK